MRSGHLISYPNFVADLSANLQSHENSFEALAKCRKASPGYQGTADRHLREYGNERIVALLPPNNGGCDVSPNLWHFRSRSRTQAFCKICLIAKSPEASKRREISLQLSDRSETRHASRQQCRRCTCQISERYNVNTQSRYIESSQL